MSTEEWVTIILYCGHEVPWVRGQHPRRGAFVPCLRCDSHKHVKDILRRKRAA